jgi:hypothetical protein
MTRATLVVFGATWAAALAFGCSESSDSGSEATGGSGSGGMRAGSGGSATGGSGTGGVTTGGAASGGSSTGGTTTGGASSGGSTAKGGASTGGTATGGAASAAGGSSVTGGRSGNGGAAPSGGNSDTGGKSGSGGASPSGGTSGNGGATPTGGKASGGAGNAPAIGPGPCGCETPAGEFGTVNETIVVESGKTYDGGCKIFRANPSTLGAGDQGEDQKPVFRVNDGATLKNIVIGASAADGVHLYGDVTLENIHWLDIGEDAMTVKESGTVHLNCGSAAHGEDKIFQVNAASDLFISNFTATDGGKFMRQNGDTTFKMTVTIDHCDISNIDEVIYRTDSSSSHVTLTNTRYSDLGDGLFRFGDQIVNGSSGQSTVSNNQEY